MLFRNIKLLLYFQNSLSNESGERKSMATISQQPWHMPLSISFNSFICKLFNYERMTGNAHIFPLRTTWQETKNYFGRQAEFSSICCTSFWVITCRLFFLLQERVGTEKSFAIFISPVEFISHGPIVFRGRSHIKQPFFNTDLSFYICNT